MVRCTECDAEWPSPAYADTCAENDRAEQYDRDHGHLFHSNREV